MSEDKYQYDFAELYGGGMYNEDRRQQKAQKMIAVLSDYHSNQLKDLAVLDIGSSTGIIDNILAQNFESVVGVDIDQKAVEYATQQFKADNLSFKLQDGNHLDFNDNTFDVIICAQVYEHVPDATQLLSEIHRVLKPNGICYFSAGNRMMLKEVHYKLPFLSIIPKSLAHLYLRLAGKGTHYYETHLTLWGLKSLVKNFEIIDYTKKVVSDPDKFFATEMVPANSRKQTLALQVLKYAYWLFPNYLWLLRKKM